MGNMAISGTADITHEGIKKHFTKWKKYPFQSVIELIANGFDSGATSVDVTIEHNEMHGLAAISVLDNGSGIDIKECDQHFSRFNESSKQGDDDLQGAHGKEREGLLFIYSAQMQLGTPNAMTLNLRYS